MMNRTRFWAILLVCLFPFQASAALFEDTDARRSILDLRARMNEKADKSAMLELSKQNELLRQEVDRLRGQIEVLTNELRSIQKKQKDFYVDLDNRVGKLEPQRVSVDGKDVTVASDEKILFDKAESAFAGGEYSTAVSAYAAFLKRYPASGMASLAQFGLGNAYYMLKDYKNALAAQNAVLKKYPNSSKAPDAMLNMASSQLGLKSLSSAKKTLNALIKKYPQSSAAGEAKARLDKMK